jgi:hypothetical protein
MGEVPGMDNYGGNLTDEAFDNPAMELLKDGKVNAASYHKLQHCLLSLPDSLSRTYPQLLVERS